MSSIFGRQVIVPLTNKSGGSVAKGDVVIVDSANNESFTTTTSAGVTTPIGIAQETIASNATGRVLIEGYADLVNVNASVTRLNYGKTHTVAKQATDAGSARIAGTFCCFLKSGTTPSALIFPVDLAAAALTDPTTTRGDFIARGAGALQRLALGAAGTVMQSDGTDPSWTSLADLGLVIATYTPTLTASVSNPTLGSGSTATGRYFRIGKLVICQIQIVFGSSGVAAGSGTYQVSLPVAADASNPAVFGTGNMFDSSAGVFSPAVAYTNFDGTNIRFTQSGSVLVNNASPWVWAASDHIQALINYEAD